MNKRGNFMPIMDMNTDEKGQLDEIVKSGEPLDKSSLSIIETYKFHDIINLLYKYKHPENLSTNLVNVINNGINPDSLLIIYPNLSEEMISFFNENIIKAAEKLTKSTSTSFTQNVEANKIIENANKTVLATNSLSKATIDINDITRIEVNEKLETPLRDTKKDINPLSLLRIESDNHFLDAETISKYKRLIINEGNRSDRFYILTEYMNFSPEMLKDFIEDILGTTSRILEKTSLLPISGQISISKSLRKQQKNIINNANEAKIMLKYLLDNKVISKETFDQIILDHENNTQKRLSNKEEMKQNTNDPYYLIRINSTVKKEDVVFKETDKKDRTHTTILADKNIIIDFMNIFTEKDSVDFYASVLLNPNRGICMNNKYYTLFNHFMHSPNYQNFSESQKIAEIKDEGKFLEYLMMHPHNIITEEISAFGIKKTIYKISLQSDL